MSESQHQQHIAIVGGGVAGLVAARDLAAAGARVSLWEREAELGGRIRAVTLNGVPVDVGAEAFATRGGGVAGYLAELGLAERIVYPAALGSWVVAGERALPLPPGGAIGIPARPLSAAARSHLGLWGAVRAAVEPWLPRERVRSNDAADPTIAELVTARLGSRVCDRLVRPVTLGVYSADPEQLRLSAVPGLAAAYAREGSLVRAARQLRAASSAAGGAVAALQGGMTTLITTLTAAAQEAGVVIHTDADVAALTPSAAAPAEYAPAEHAPAADHPRAGWVLRDGAGAELTRADAVLVAVPEPVAHTLLGARGAGPVNAEVEVIALAVVDPRLDVAPRGTGVLVAAGALGDLAQPETAQLEQTQPILAKALTHATAKWPDRQALRPTGEHVVRVSYGRAGSAPETLGLDDAAAFERARADASRILGIELTPASVVDQARQRWEMGAPPGTAARIVPPQGVALAGDWVHGTGLASVIPGARRAARELFDSLAGPAHETSPHHTEDESEVRSA